MYTFQVKFQLRGGAKKFCEVIADGLSEAIGKARREHLNGSNKVIAVTAYRWNERTAATA